MHRPQVPALVVVPGGTYRLGSDDGLPDESPVRDVVLATFRAAVRPITNAEHELFAAATGAPRAPFAGRHGFGDPEQPVVGVSWHDAVAYCNWLSEETGHRYRLPTESEREAAARGGLVGCRWPWGDVAPDVHPTAAAVTGLSRPHVPTSACANGWGLQCMGDNVHEWCSDWYLHAARTEPQPDVERQPERRASRGGSWRHSVKHARVSARSSLPPTYRYDDYGFRVFADA